MCWAGSVREMRPSPGKLRKVGVGKDNQGVPKPPMGASGTGGSSCMRVVSGAFARADLALAPAWAREAAAASDAWPCCTFNGGWSRGPGSPLASVNGPINDVWERNVSVEGGWERV